MKRSPVFIILLYASVLLTMQLNTAKSHASDPPSEAQLWRALKTGAAIALMRHALAPGTGDPPNFVIDDCRTQRNLSNNGRKQATAIGNRFRSHGIRNAEVFTSEWCRCRETAELLKFSKIRPLKMLNSFFQHFERAEPQTEELKSWLIAHQSNTPTVLVTHQVNITALTGIFPRSGEIIVVRRRADGRFAVLGSL